MYRTSKRPGDVEDQPKLKDPVYGAGGVLLVNGQVLVVIEDATDDSYGKRKGMLSVPMGRAKIGRECLHETAEREFCEETGRSVKAIQYLGKLVIPGMPGGIVEMYLMEANGQEPSQARERLLVTKWLPPDDILNMPDDLVRPPTKPAVELALLWDKWLQTGNKRELLRLHPPR